MQKSFVRIVPLAACMLLFSGIASAQVLYGINYTGNDGLSTLNTVSTANGAATPIGAIGFQRCGAMDISAAGVLYATCERNDGSNTPVLITIDPTTGAGTEVGPTGITGAVGDISFRPSDGVLFAFDATNDPLHSLYTINTATGAATLVGDTGLSFAGGNAMSFDSAGVLFHSQFTSGPSPNLNTLNTATGAATLVGQVTPSTGRFNSMDANPTSGTLYATENNGAGGTGPTNLVTIDTVGLTATTVGATLADLDALAFQPTGGGGGLVPQIELPTTTVSTLVGLALALALLAFWNFRSRRLRRDGRFD